MKPEMNDFINDLELPKSGKFSNNQYIVELKDDNQFSNLYTKLSFSLDESDSSITTPDNVYYEFHNDWFNVNISADFVKDIYRLVVEERWKFL